MSYTNDPYGRPSEYGQQQGYGQQPGYGQQQPGYGQQPGKNGPRNNPFGAESDEQFGIVGLSMGLLGGIVLIVAFTGLDWFSISSNSLSFGDVSDGIDANGGAAGFASAYFGWFAWTFAIIAVIAAVASSFPSPAVRAARVIGVVAGFAAAGLSFLALQLNDGIGYTTYLKDARIGFYLAVIGFIVVGIGAAIGPRKV